MGLESYRPARLLIYVELGSVAPPVGQTKPNHLGRANIRPSHTGYESTRELVPWVRMLSGEQKT